jgi:hypothetical protein
MILRWHFNGGYLCILAILLWFFSRNNILIWHRNEWNKLVYHYTTRMWCYKAKVANVNNGFSNYCCIFQCGEKATKMTLSLLL